MTKKEAKAISYFNECDIVINGNGTTHISHEEMKQMKVGLVETSKKFKIVITGFIISSDGDGLHRYAKSLKRRLEDSEGDNIEFI